MSELSDVLNDPLFKKLSPEKQQQKIMEISARTTTGNKATNPIDAQPTDKSFNTMQMTHMDEDDPDTTMMQRLLGGGAGAIQGGAMGGLLGGLPGAAGGAISEGMSGFAFPPKSKGQWAAQAASGPLGALGGAATGLAKNKTAQTGIAGLMGLLHNYALNGVSEGVDQRGDKITPSVPQALLSILGPAAGHHLTNTVTSERPVVKSNELIEGMTGNKAKISDMPALETLQHNNPDLASIILAGKEPTPAQIANSTRQARLERDIRKTTNARNVIGEKKAENAVDTAVNLAAKAKKEVVTVKARLGIQPDITQQATDNAGPVASDLNQAQFDLREGKRFGPPNEDTSYNEHVNDLDKNVLDKQMTANEAKAELIRLKAEDQAYGGASKVDAAETKSANASIAIDTKGQGWRDKQLKSRQDFFNQQLDDLRKDSNSQSIALHPDLGKLTGSDIVTGNDLIHKLGSPDISASGLEAYRQRIKSKMGTKGTQQLEDSMVEEFFRQAYDPKTKTLSNAPQVFSKEGNFPAEKILAMYGGGAKAQEKLQTLTRTTEAIRALQAPGGPFKEFGKRLGAHVAWVLPNMLIFHPEALPVTAGSMAAAGGVVGSAILYPKLIDAMLRNPKRGEDFYKWATSTSRTGRSLANWPRLAAWLKSNSEPISPDDE